MNLATRSFVLWPLVLFTRASRNSGVTVAASLSSFSSLAFAFSNNNNKIESLSSSTFTGNQKRTIIMSQPASTSSHKCKGGHCQRQNDSPTTTTTTPTTMTYKRTFYRRVLPESCVGLSTKKGKQIFQSAMIHNGLKSFFPLIEQYTTQSEPSFCGISTLVLVLNALSVDPRRTWKGPWRWYVESMLNCCLDLEQVKQTGITLNDYVCLAKCQGLTVQASHAENVTLNDFRNAVQQACVETEQQAEKEEENDNGTTAKNEEPPPPPLDILTVSYSRKVLGQTGSGHFSPIAAYDEVSDRVLILDTARFKYGAHWVSLPLLFDAMLPHDPDTGKSRGFVVLSFPSANETMTISDNNDKDETTSLLQPVSLLFQSKMSQMPIRKQYKEYLKSIKSEKTITWPQVVEYWMTTKFNNNHHHAVQDMLEPQLTPVDNQVLEIVEDTVTLLQCLIPDNNEEQQLLSNQQTLSTPPHHDQSMIKTCKPGCRVNMTRTLCLSTREILFVVYLASLDPIH